MTASTLSPEVLSGLRERLEPCPFCGGAVELTSSKTLGDRLFCIKCPDDSPCVGSGLGIYVVAGQVETAIAAWNRRAASPSIGRVGGDAARALGLLAAEDERNDKIHDLLETIREQIRLEVAPEHRPDGLMKNIQNAVYAMRGRMRLMNDAAITSPLSSLVSHEEPAGDTQGALPVTDETQPAIWVSAAQLAEHVDPDPRDGSEGGNYLPARKTRRGLFQTPLYTHPAALVSPPDNGEPGNG